MYTFLHSLLYDGLNRLFIDFIDSIFNQPFVVFLNEKSTELSCISAQTLQIITYEQQYFGLSFHKYTIFHVQCILREGSSTKHDGVFSVNIVISE